LDFHTPGKGGQGGVVASNDDSNPTDTYPHGTVIYAPWWRLYDSSWNLISPSRPDHFGVPWLASPSQDLAFRMQFGPAALNIPDATITPIWFDPKDAPEPSSVILCGIGGFLIWAVRHRWSRLT